MITNQNPRINNSKSGKMLFLIFALLLFNFSMFAQSSQGVDLTFETAVSTDTGISNSTVNPQLTVQSDGKVLVYGNFNNAGGVPKNKIARLNTDGTLDTSFNCVCANFSGIGSAVVQPDGKIIIAGSYGNGPSARIARLNPNGSVDNSLVSPFNQGFGGATVWGLAPDGKIYVTQAFFGFHLSYYALSRLNTDGSFDNSFTSVGFDNWNGKDYLYALQVLPDGKLMIGGKRGSDYLFRVNTNGTKDTTFESPILANGNQQFPWSYVYDFGIQSSGKIVIIGNFTTVNGVSRQGFARMNVDASVDMDFASPNSGFALKVVSGDKILIDGSRRLNPDGTLDNTFNPAYTNFTAWKLDSLERIIVAGLFTEGSVTSRRIARMNADGSADNSFNQMYLGFTGEVSTLASQPDGKTIINGYFNRVNGIITPTLVRVNANGSLDTSFNTGTAVESYLLNTIKAQSDGKILLGGGFSSYNGTPRQGIARINADGSLDAAFNPILSSGGSVNAIAVQSDGKILIGGGFSTVNGTGRTSLARLNSDGTLDTTFNPTLGSPTVYSIIVQANGQVMVGGAYSGVNGFNRQNLARLNSDGTLDTSFNAGTISSVVQVAQQSNGKYLYLSFGSISRRNADGTADGSFPTPTTATDGSTAPYIRRFALQPDGNIVVVGNFSSINNTPRNNIARLRPDAIVDTTFFPIGTDRSINDVIVQPDGNVIIGGAFTTVESIERNGIARLIPAAFHRVSLFDYDGDGRSDISIFRPSENKWYVRRSSDGQVTQQVFAIAGDVPVPADYDGDGKTDFAIFRPSSGDWWALSSINGSQVYAHWGAAQNINRPSDFDGDGKADYVFYLDSNSYWYRYGSSAGANYVNFGLAGDKPVTGDFDGDGKSDVAIFRPSTGDWWWRSSIDSAQRATHWGISTDIPAPADYDGDGKTDFAVYRPSTGVWYIYNSATLTSTILNFGLAEDKPVPADYDGDGKADIAVFRPSTGVWYLMKSTEGFTAIQFGISTDIPTPNAFVP